MPTRADLSGAIEDALQAPSIHNTQPWRWRIHSDSAELHADWDRHLTVTDPDRRDLVLSCGAALHHLQVALAARGFAVDVERVPDPEDSSHLATVLLNPGDTGAQPDQDRAALYPGIAQRRTDRRRMSGRPVPQDNLRSLVDRVQGSGATLLPVTDAAAREQLAALLDDAGKHQYRTPGYASELRMWTHRLPAGHDGIPAANVAPRTGHYSGSALRRFPRSALAQPPNPPGHGVGDDAAELLVVTTPADGLPDRLRAGEAMSDVLLAATLMGLATTPLSQGLEIEATRQRIQRDVLGIPEYPQIVIRMGWPATGAAALPMTPRRPLPAVLLKP